MTVVATCVAAACFAGGYAIGKRDNEGDIDPHERRQDGEGSRGRAGLSALPAGGSASGGASRATRALREIARDGQLGTFVKLRAYARLANSVPTDELDELLREVRREVPEELGGDDIARLIGSRWAREDPLGAFTALMRGEPPSLGEADGVIFRSIAEADPEFAMELVLGMSSAERQGEALVQLLQTFGSLDMVSTLARVKDLPEPNLHRRAIGRFLKDAAQREPVAALDALVDLPRGVAPMDFYTVAFSRLAEADPDAARDRLGELRDPRARREALIGMAPALTKEGDLNSMREWLASLPTSGERDIALAAVLREHPDSAVAAAAVADLRSPRVRAQVSGEIASRLYEEDPPAAWEWIENDLEGRARLGAQQMLFEEHGGSMEFEQQLGLAEQIPGEGRAKRDFVERWAERDPAAAADWVAEQTGRPERLMSEVYERWVRTDIEAAEAFAETLPEGELADAALDQIMRVRERDRAREGERAVEYEL